MDLNKYCEMCKRSYAVKRDRKQGVEYYVQQRKKRRKKKYMHLVGKHLKRIKLK